METGARSAEACLGEAGVLIVEDEFLIALEIEDFLSGKGCRVIGPALSVKEAMALLETEAPVVAVLDVNLRGEAVTPVATALRRRNIPFVVASAYEQKHLDEDPILRGVVNLGKPVSADRLLAEITRLVVCARADP